MGRLTKWKPGQAYCGTPMEAINFALDLSQSDASSAIIFLNDWRGGDLAEWSEFQFKPQQ